MILSKMGDFREEIRKYTIKVKVRRAREKREKEKFWREFKQFIPVLLVLGKTYAWHFLIWLTRYFPFSLLSNFTWINYQNREVFQARCAIGDTGYLTGTYFEIEEFYKDDNFIFFKGKFKRVIKHSSRKMFIEGLGKIYGNGNIYLSDIEKGMQLLKINRESVLNRQYLSFASEKV